MAKKQFLYDDVEITGALTVRGPLNNDGVARVVTRTAQTEGDITTVSGIATAALQGPYDYVNNVPPTNPITDLHITATANSDGSINFDLDWLYEQGAVPCDGFLVYYKSDIHAPDAIDLVNDPCVFVAWNGESY